MGQYTAPELVERIVAKAPTEAQAGHFGTHKELFGEYGYAKPMLNYSWQWVWNKARLISEDANMLDIILHHLNK